MIRLSLEGKKRRGHDPFHCIGEKKNKNDKNRLWRKEERRKRLPEPAHNEGKEQERKSLGKTGRLINKKGGFSLPLTLQRGRGKGKGRTKNVSLSQGKGGETRGKGSTLKKTKKGKNRIVSF